MSGSGTQGIGVGSTLLSVALVACANDPAPNDPNCLSVQAGFGPAGTVPVRAEVVVTGLEVPWSLAFLPNGDWLVTERPGRIRVVRGGVLLPPVAEVSITRNAEGGLLGLALHPLFAENRFFYIYFTTSKQNRDVNRVERWRLAEDGASAEHERVILDDIPASVFHDGGRIRFGPDAKLYVGTGDARNPDSSQSRTSVAGKLLRLEPDGTIPSDNPDPASPVFLSGVRNVQAFDWLDRTTLVLADHGPSGELGRSGNDELNVVGAGQNLGWPAVSGCEQRSGMISPRIAWKQALPPGGLAVIAEARSPNGAEACSSRRSVRNICSAWSSLGCANGRASRSLLSR